MARFLLRRTTKWMLGGTALATAALILPPKEVLPPPLLPCRVLMEGVGRVSRCVYVGGVIFFDYTYNLHGTERQADQEAWNRVHEKSAHRLVSLCERNGGLYVKAGQIFANMSHVLPLQYCRIMSVLQDDVCTRPYSEIVAVLESDLHKPIDEVFAYIDPTPIAAASLAQVHKATLRKEQTNVAIKVQYIDIAQRFKGDMSTISLMLSIAGYIYPGFNFGEVISKLNDTVAAELDFRAEARNSDRASRELLQGGFGNRVVCPRMYWDYITERILVSQFVEDGIKISDRRKLIAQHINPSEVSKWFIDAIAYQMFTTGFFHGDPHAGNVLVHKLPNSNKPQVVLLDFGLCAELDEYHRRELAAIWTSSITHNSSALIELAHRYSCDNYELFASCFLQHPYNYFTSTRGRLLDKAAQESMRDTMRQNMTGINNIVAALPKEYTLVLRSIMATKAINRELGDVVNRPLRMLRYSLPASNESMWLWNVYYMYLRAWIAEQISAMVLAYTKWRYPQAAEMIESALQVSGEDMLL